MASKVRDLSKNLGHYKYEKGAHLYHAADGVAGGGNYGNEKRHKLRRALAKIRLRASGMSDDILGSKEVGGRFENVHEKEV